MSTLAILKQARKQQVITMLHTYEMKLDDVPAAVEIIRQNYSAEDARLAMWEIMNAMNGSKPQPVYFVAVIDKTIIGVLGICDSFMDTRVYEIFWVNVLPDWQGTGVGSKLVKRALQHAMEREAGGVMLTVRGGTADFYKRLGFATILSIPDGTEMDYMMHAYPKVALQHARK